VSSAERAASLITKIDPREFRVLQAIELGMSKYEFVPLNFITRFTGFPIQEVEHWIDELDLNDLLWRQSEGYLGYILNYNSYDLLALNALVRSEVVEALGMSLGMGKEADIFEALTPSNIKVAIKFHRLGRISFRDTRRKREYIANRHHISWLYQSRLAAEKEYNALSIVKKAGVCVPEPIAQNRHTIVMEKIEGNQIGEIASLEDPKSFLNEILINVKKSFNAGIIHADLSEFNIMVTNDGRIYIIDWPQYIKKDHKNSEEYLERDLQNILNFFNRKFNIDMKINEALQIIRS